MQDAARLGRSVLAFAVGCAAGAAAAPAQPFVAAATSSVTTAVVVEGADALDAALDKVGLARKDLGWQPKAWWLRYPRDVRHKLPIIDDLLADPLATVPFIRTFGEGSRQLLGPAQIGADAPPSTLTKLGGGSRGITRYAHLAIDNKYAGIRLITLQLETADIGLDEAILQIYRDKGRKTAFHTVNQAKPYPDLGADLRTRLTKMPPELSAILGRLLTNIVIAHRWADAALRDVPIEQRLGARRRLDLGLDLALSDDYSSVRVFDDMASQWDAPSLWYGALVAIEALDRARSELQLLPPRTLAIEDFDWPTPMGWVRIRGRGASRISSDDTLLAIDVGGDDLWSGEVGASSSSRPLGVALDLSGNDIYESEGYAQGAGITGIGILFDAAGNDRYRASGAYAQGVAQLGFGALVDLGGNDDYQASYAAQASAPFEGVGLLVDAGGRDQYRIVANGQAYAGPGSVAILADRDGDDSYVAEKDGRLSGQMSYGLDPHITAGSAGSTALAQGVGAGLAQAHVTSRIWAGGLGALIDVAGDDFYSSGNWSQGTGYFFGTGLLYDGAGSDRYDGEGIRNQAAAVHYAVGALVDEGGDDQHRKGDLAFAADFSVAIFAKRGGNDRYTIGEVSQTIGLGSAQRRSVAIFADSGGDDVYQSIVGLKPGNLSAAGGRSGHADGPFEGVAIGPFYDHIPSVALFIDAGGKDIYWDGLANDSTWISAVDRAAGNFAVGIDNDGTRIDWRANRP